MGVGRGCEGERGMVLGESVQAVREEVEVGHSKGLASSAWGRTWRVWRRKGGVVYGVGNTDKLVYVCINLLCYFNTVVSLNYVFFSIHQCSLISSYHIWAYELHLLQS